MAHPTTADRTAVRTAAISANGGWCWFQDERAMVDPVTGTLLLGAVASVGGAEGERRGGDIDLHIVDLARLGEPAAVTTAVLHAGLESDDHDNPALWHRADGRWLAVYSRHKSDDLTRWRISETADPTRWGPEQSFDWNQLFESPEQTEALGGGRGVTYQNLHALDGVLHCFVRAVNDDPCYLVSHDDGTTWGFGGRLLTREKIGYVNGYARYASGTRFGTEDRIDLIITEHHPRDYGTSIWHGYLAGGHLHRADGTVVGELGRGLNAPAPRAEDLTPVFENGSTWDGTVMTHAWTTDLRRFADGTLVALMTARADDTLGPGGDCRGHGPIDHRFFRGVLAPGRTRWQVRELAAAGPQLFPHEEDYTGLATVDPDDPDALWLSTVVDPRDGAVLEHHEIFHGATADDGENWAWTPVTEGSAVDNVRPIAVPGDPGREVLAWYRGSLRSSQHYDAEVMVRARPRERGTPAGEMARRLRTLGGVTAWDELDPEVHRTWDAPYGPAEQWELRVEDREIPGPHGPVPVRIYTPRATAEGPRPCLLWCHGGGFMHGDLDMPEGDHVARGIAGRADAVVVSVDYRLCDEIDGTPARRFPGGPAQVTAPIPLDDVCATVVWTRQAADALGIDPARIAIGGASAGGNLAAAASLRLADEGSPLA
ncbi:MAG: alpha/beta hydrolase, partial [Brachybacterium sp.]|nr:alpha/beta hydrolase [Brachybacterium sp.]